MLQDQSIVVQKKGNEANEANIVVTKLVGRRKNIITKTLLGFRQVGFLMRGIANTQASPRNLFALARYPTKDPTKNGARKTDG